MSDPEPYTTTEFNALRTDARPDRMRATVEALERVTRELQEREDDHYLTKEVLHIQIDFARHDIAKLKAERDALKAALTKAVSLTCNCASDPEFRVLGHAGWCDAREALGEVRR